MNGTDLHDRDPRDRVWKLYEVVVRDEHYHREIFQRRIQYHAALLLAFAGGIAAGYFKATAAMHFGVLAVLSAAFTWLAFSTPGATERVYEHFIEFLRTREFLEAYLGSRCPTAIDRRPRLASEFRAVPAGTQWWPEGFVFTKLWSDPGDKKGYHARVSAQMRGLGFMGIASAATSIVLLAIEVQR